MPAEAVDVTDQRSPASFYAKILAQVQPRQIGQITLVNFANDAGLEPLGGNLYRETVASGNPTEGTPTSIGFGKLRQGYLEGFQRRSRQGDHGADRGAALLRDERQGHHRRRPDGRHHHQPSGKERAS